MKKRSTIYRRGAEDAEKAGQGECRTTRTARSSQTKSPRRSIALLLPLSFPLRSPRLCGYIFITALLLFTSCKNAELKPEEFAAEDVCGHCKMAISEKQFAAEFFTTEGDVRKFDDIGCMVNYLKDNRATASAAYFFVDYETKKWVKANAVTFVKSAQLRTPMSGGIVAFDEKNKAENAAQKMTGKIVTLEELTR